MPEMTETVIGGVVLASISVITLAARALRNRSSTLVIQKFALYTVPLQSDSPTIEIVGRMKGLVAFTLSLMGFSPITRFTLTDKDLRCESTSLSGQKSQFIPIQSVSTVSAGVYKPFTSILWAYSLVFVGAFLGFQSGSWVPFGIAMLIAAAFVAQYFLAKKFFIEVHANGGSPLSLLFTPNVIEGVPVNVDQALAVASVIRDRVLGHQEQAPSIGAPES